MNGLVRFSARAIAAACTLLLIGSTALRAQTAPSTSNHSTTTQSASTLSPSIVGQSGLEFLENKGQVVDEQGRKVESVRFTAHSQGAKLFLMPDRIAHVFIEASGPGAKHEPGKGISSKELDQTRIRYQRVDMKLVGASSTVNLRGEGVLPGVTNFFTASAGPEGITGVRSFSTVVYENVYPNIDLVLKARGKGMKAEYIVRPGGDPRSIRLRITGAQGLERTPEGGYRIRTALGTITEDAPYSFVRTADGSEQEVAVRFLIEGDEIAFDVPAYDHSQTLVIDPGRDWGTFHGGTAEDVGTGIAVQRSFNPSNTTPYIYICGYTAGGTFPIVSASQGTYGGGAYDAFVAAYQYGGARQYSTYYGGSNDDRAWGITADGSGNVWVVGQTRSAAWTGSAFTNTPAGDIDAFVARFNSTGVPQAARFVGGANDDYFLAVAYDGTNLTCGGYTASPGLATTGVFQTTYNGLYCGMIARLPATSLNAITWLTYYGNNTGSLNGQETYVTSLSPRGTSGEVWVGGYTNSPNTSNAIATTGSFKTFPNGFLPNFVNYDGFVALMTSSGGRTASTYYGGDEDDRVLGVAADPLDANAVIAVGRTNSTNVGNFIASATGFNTVLNNGTNSTAFADGFVTRLTVSGTTLQRDWGSYWGSTQDDYLTSVAVDDNNVNEAGSNTISAGRGGKIFVAGLTAGTSGNFATYNFDASFNTNQGGYDAVWSRIRRAPGGSPVVEYSVITGGSGNDIANGIAVDNQRNVHIVGTATTPGGGNLAGGSGAAQTGYGGGLSDAFAVKWCDLIVPNAPQFSTTGEGGTFTSTVSVCQSFNSSATGFVTTLGPYPSVQPGTTYGSCPPSAVQTLTVRLTNAVQGVQYRLENTTSSNFINITPGTGTSAVTANTVLATQDGTVYVSISAANLPAPGTYNLRWVAYTQTVGSSCQENGVTGALTVNALPANNAISQTAPGTDNNSAAAPGSTFNFYVCGGSANSFTVAPGSGLTYNWCVMQNGLVTTAPTVSGANNQTVTITPNTGAGQRDTLYLRVRISNTNGCAIEYQAALYVLPVVDIQTGIANETSDPDANPLNLCVNSGGTVTAPATYSYQDSGPHTLVNTYGNATIPGNGATGGDAVTAVTPQNYGWTTNAPVGSINSVSFTNASSPNGGTVSVTYGIAPNDFAGMLNPTTVQFTLTESYGSGGISGCSRNATYNVNFYPQPTVTVTPIPAGPICEGTPVQFTITVTPSSITSGSFSVTLNAASQTGAQISSGTNVSGGTFGGTTYSGNFTNNPFTLTVDPGTVTSAYDALGLISLTVNSLTNGLSPVCGLASSVTSASVTITQNPDPITSYQQARANTTNTPNYGIGIPSGNLVPPTTSQTGTSFEACLYDPIDGFGQEYTYTIVSPSTIPLPNGNDNYIWSIPGIPGIDFTLVSGGGTQLGSAPPSATIRWLTTGSRTITITQVNDQLPGTCQTVNNFVVNVNNLPSSPGSINWQQANWCENSTVSFTYTVPALATAAFPIQVQFYGENVDALGPGVTTYIPTPMVAITQTFTAAQAGTTVGPFSFTAGNIISVGPPTWVDISIAVSIVDANGCGRWGPAGVGDPFRSVSTRIWDIAAEPQVEDWAGNAGPFTACPNKTTDPYALVPATGITYPDDSPLGNPNDGWYHYQIANLSAYPVGTTFNWRLVDNAGNPLIVNTDYEITLTSSGLNYTNDRAQIRYGKNLDALTQPLYLDIEVTFPSSSGGCTLPFGSPFHSTADVTISPEPNPNISGADLNGTNSLTNPPGLCSGQTAQYDCGVPGASYSWTILPTGAGGNSPPWGTAPTFVGPNNTQVVTIDWPAFSDVPIRLPRIDVVVQNSAGCYEGDTATAYILLAPDATPIMVGPEGPCVFNGENSHIKAFTVPKSTNYTIASVSWSLVNGYGAVYSYSTTGAPFTLPNANDTVRYQFYSAGNETITATVTATNGCSVTGSLNFTIFPPPNPVISGPASVCYGQTGVPYAATPYIYPDTYLWEIIPSNGGTIIPGSTPDQITINWNGTGGANTYQIRLTQISAQGCTARVYYTVVVNPLPTPFVSGPSTICVNQNYTYTTQNNAPASSYVWSILSNTASASIVSGQNTATVTVSAANTGSFDLMVTETIIATSCSASHTKAGIQVVASPTPSISRQSPPGPVGQACVGQTITYLTPASGNAYQWSVTGGGSIVGASTNNTVDIAWSATGSQTITLTETIGNCSVTVTQTVNVVPLPTPAVMGPTSPCQNTAVTYMTTNNTGSTYSWTTSGASFTASGPTNTYQLNGMWTGTGSGTVTVTETNSIGCVQTNSLNVIVQPAPTPTITASQANPICGGQTVTFTATPSGATSYTWTVGSNGTLQSGQGTSSIVVSWANVPSSYSSSVSVVVNVGGCTGSAFYTVNVIPQATPMISGPATICSGQSGTYSTPLTTGRTYSWSTTSTPPGMTPFSQSGVNLNSVTINWVNTSSSPFVATVQVVESAGGVCTGTATYNVTVNPLPITAITGPTSVCQGQTVTYSHTPALTGHSFAWTVTNAQSWSGQGTGAITVTWGNTNGTVALTVTNNSTGCTNTATNSPLPVTVNPNPTPTISGNVNPCAGSTHTYSTQTGMTSYNWSITPASAGTIIGQNDQSSVTIQWSNTQVTATLTVQVNNSGCTGQQSITINVQPNPTPAISGVAQTCPGVDRTYTTLYTAGNTYSWMISYTPGFIITGGSTTSNTVTVRFNSPGASSQTATLQVTETSPYGCQGTATQTVTVQPAPQPVISGNTNVCGYLAQYDDIPINNTETYVVSDANGIDYTTANIVWTLPFGGGTFTGASSGTGVTTITVQWDEPTAAATVSRQIAAQVTLGAPTNCTGQTTSNVQVNWNPKPSISGPRAWCDNSLYTANSTNASQSGLATYSVQVPETPVLPAGSSRTYNWTITPASAGTVVSGQGTPTVQVSWTSGLANTPLNAVLSVTETINYLNNSATPTNKFCGITDTFRVVINPIPKPVITSPNNGITGPNLQGPCGRDIYTYQVTADANSSYQWVVSGGSIIGASTGNSINVQWNNVTSPTPGYVGVTQTFLTPATMCSTYVQQNLTIQVKPSPKVIGPTVLCQQTNNGTNVGNYTVQTVVAGNTYQWFAEPASLVISTVVSGPQNENFQVTWGGTSSTPLTAHVIVRETNPVTGCLERDTLTITLNPNPTPVITSTTGGLNPNGVCEGSTHIYQTQFNTGNSYLWTVTGGTISGAATNNQVTVVWGSAGTGTITVREQVGAMYGSGCWTEVTATVTIRPLPNPVITGPTTVCRYTEQSYAVQTPNVNNTYQWTVTNGIIQGSSTDPTVTVLWYDVPTGTIAVTETTPPSQGSCSNTASVNVTINPKPAPVISGPPAPPVCVNSTQTYSTPLVTGDTYQWTVTGGTIGGAATNNTVTVTWTTVGNGTISVKQTNTLGCDTTVSRTIPVNALPSVTITPSGPTTICNGQSLTLLATPGFVSYSWNTGETTPNIVVTQSGTYVVTVVDNNGCSNNSNSITVTVQNVPAPQIQVSGPTTFCQGQSVTLSITGTNIQGYAWSNGATTSSITVTTSGSYWCEVTYNNGCRARTEIIEVTVVPRPTVSITANGPTSFCEGGSVVLSAGAGFATYAWSNGTQTVGTSSTLTVTQAGTYTVTVTNNIGCSATSQPVEVTVYPKPAPQIQASGPTEFCEGGSVTLDAGAGFASYQWSNGATTRTITVTQQGSYTVTVTDQNNCSGTSQPVVVTVYPKPPKPTITQTGGTLTSSSAAQYQWYYNGQPISGATDRSYTLVRDRDQSGYYKVSIRDNNGCENTSDSIYIDITPVEVAGDNTGIQFIPNPTSGELRIVFGDAIGAEHARVIVRNLVGRELLSVELGAISAGSSKTIDLANLPNGVYMVEVILPSGMRTIGRVTKVD